ncbi:MAG: hypothetical protein CM15mP49_01400 [Actinomycetota bacterium]|nr:MAG: hypothetical protein CM15mP49_01400 [Actinomycetota bacterium]
MTTFFKKAMLYLGLGSDEDFLGMDPQGLKNDLRRWCDVNRPLRNSNVKPITRRCRWCKDRKRSCHCYYSTKRKFVKPHIVTPIRFAEVKEISEAARRSQPVIVNLQQANMMLRKNH